MCRHSCLSSPQNPEVKHLKKLQHKKYRQLHQQLIIEEEKMIQEALHQNLPMTIYYLCGEEVSFPAIRFRFLDASIMKLVSTNTSLNRMIAMVEYRSLPQESDRVLVLSEIQDPGNLGTLLRLAVAFDYRQVFLWKCVDYFNSKVVHSSKGALFQLQMTVVTDLGVILSELSENGFMVYGTSLQEDSISVRTVPPVTKVALVLGNEGRGLSTEVLQYCHQTLIIPIKNFDSLNVAMAGAILMYQLSDEQE